MNLLRLVVLANGRDPQRSASLPLEESASLIYLTLHVAVVLEWQFFLFSIPNLYIFWDFGWCL
jgi:hypothetical protein